MGGIEINRWVRVMGVVRNTPASLQQASFWAV